MNPQTAFKIRMLWNNYGCLYKLTGFGVGLQIFYTNIMYAEESPLVKATVHRVKYATKDEKTLDNSKKLKQIARAETNTFGIKVFMMSFLKGAVYGTFWPASIAKIAYDSTQPNDDYDSHFIPFSKNYFECTGKNGLWCKSCKSYKMSRIQ